MPIRGQLAPEDCWALQPWGEDYAVLAKWNGMIAWFHVLPASLAVVLFPGETS